MGISIIGNDYTYEKEKEFPYEDNCIACEFLKSGKAINHLEAVFHALEEVRKNNPEKLEEADADMCEYHKKKISTMTISISKDHYEVLDPQRARPDRRYHGAGLVKTDIISEDEYNEEPEIEEEKDETNL